MERYLLKKLIKLDRINLETILDLERTWKGTFARTVSYMENVREEIPIEPSAFIIGAQRISVDNIEMTLANRSKEVYKINWDKWNNIKQVLLEMPLAFNQGHIQKVEYRVDSYNTIQNQFTTVLNLGPDSVGYIEMVDTIMSELHPTLEENSFILRGSMLTLPPGDYEFIVHRIYYTNGGYHAMGTVYTDDQDEPITQRTINLDLLDL